MNGPCPGCGDTYQGDHGKLCAFCEAEAKARSCDHALDVSPSGKIAFCSKCLSTRVMRNGQWESPRVLVAAEVRVTDCQLGCLDLPLSSVEVQAEPPAGGQQSAIGIDPSATPRARQPVCVDRHGIYRLRLHAGAAEIPAGKVPGREWIG
jgi:hypothetical protein